MAKDNRITLYDLQLTTGATISPFVWATKYALAHKGFDVEIVPGGFTGIMERTGGRTERVPAIVDDGEWILDSWGIAEYLDEKYPDRPLLFGDPSVKVFARFMDFWIWNTAVAPWMRCFCADYRDLSLPQDQAYITKSREVMVGKKLEEMQAGREERLPKILPQLEFLRKTLRESKWLGGDKPNYVDYRTLCCFLSTASFAKTPPMTDDDPLRDWIDRGFDLYGGLGRHPGLFPLFGLKLRDGDPEPFSKADPRGGQEKRNTGPASTREETERITKA